MFVKRSLLVLAGTLIVASWVGDALAQAPYIYPAQGQSAEQQQRDRYECHGWAVSQTGFDPANPQMAAAPPPTTAPPPSSEPQQGGLLRGAGRGAAVGAVGGAIGGNAGKGAAIGAATGALIGGFRRRDQRQRQEAERQQYQAQQQSAYAQQQQSASQGRDAYNRALAACLRGRGYTVN